MQAAIMEVSADCWERIFDNSGMEDLAILALVNRGWRALTLKYTAKELIYVPETGGITVDAEEGEFDYARARKLNKIALGLQAYIEKRRETLETIVLGFSSGGHLVKRILEAVCCCSRLRVLDIQDSTNKLSGEGRIAKSDCVTVPNLPATLRVLRLDMNIVAFVKERTKNNSQLKVLECRHLNLRACADEMAFAMLSGLHTLQLKVHLQDTEAAKYLGNLATLLDGLQCFCVRFAKRSIVSTKMIEHLSRMKSLKHLSLVHVAIKEPCISLVDNFPSLESFHLLDGDCSSIAMVENILGCRRLQVLQLVCVLDGPSQVPIFPRGDLSHSNLEVLILQFFHSDMEIDFPLMMSAPCLRSLFLHGRSLESSPSTVRAINRLNLPPEFRATISYDGAHSEEIEKAMTSCGFQYSACTDEKGLWHRLHRDGDRLERDSPRQDFRETTTFLSAMIEPNEFIEGFSVLQGLWYCLRYEEHMIYQTYIEACKVHED